MTRISSNLTFWLTLSFSCANIQAAHKTFDYVIEYKAVNFAGESRQAISVN